MKRDRFLTEVQERAEFDDGQTADGAAEAVLRTLGERIDGGEADENAS